MKRDVQIPLTLLANIKNLEIIMQGWDKNLSKNFF